MGFGLAIENATEQVVAGLGWKSGRDVHISSWARDGLPAKTDVLGGAASAVNAREMLEEKLMEREPIMKKGVAVGSRNEEEGEGRDSRPENRGERGD